MWHWLICICWTILVNLQWIPLGCGVWSFLYVIGLGWLKFFLEYNFFKIIYIYIFFSTVQHGDPVTYTCIHSYFSHYVFHHKWLDRVPSATQQDPIANPSWRQHSLFTPRSQSLPLPPLLPWQPQSILQVHDFLFFEKVHFAIY